MFISGFRKFNYTLYTSAFLLAMFTSTSQAESGTALTPNDESVNATALPSAAMSVEDSSKQLVPVSYQKVKQERLFDGLVEAVHKATVSAQTSGRVSKIYFDVNDFAKKGDVLLRIRDKDQKASLKVAQADFNHAETEFRRVEELYRKQLIAKSMVDRAESQLKSTAARLEQAQENLERTVVRAPYSGILVKRHIEVGETVHTGVALFTGLSLETLRVAVNLPQDIINVVREHKSARVLLNKEEKSLQGTTMIISPYADENTHTFLVRVNLAAGDHGLYPGMAVKVAFVTGEMHKLLVPRSAIAQRSEVTAVYVMDDQQKLSMRHIRAGANIENGMTEVLSGLQENERVMTDPVEAVSYLKEQSVN